MSEHIDVLQVGLSGFPGGVENVIMNYYRAFSKSTSCDFTCSDTSFAFQEEVTSNGGALFFLPDPMKHPFQYANKLYVVLKKKKYAAVHINMLSAANLLPVLIAYAAHNKIILHAHNSSLPGGKLRETLHRLNKPVLAKFKAERIACSPEAGQWLYGNCKDIKIFNNAVSLSRFAFSLDDRERIREQYNISKDAYVIGHVGRFAEEKNQKFLIDVFAEIKRNFADSILLLVGSGVLEQDLKEYADQKGLATSIVFAGKTFDTAAYYSAMDVFCLPSHFEGLGIVAIEAQANGVRCICSEGVPEKAVVGVNAKRIPLLKERWVKELEIKGTRVDNQAALKAAGYDITEQATLLELIYRK